MSFTYQIIIAKIDEYDIVRIYILTFIILIRASYVIKKQRIGKAYVKVNGQNLFFVQ